jgi:hypothetical protein
MGKNDYGLEAANVSTQNAYGLEPASANGPTISPGKSWSDIFAESGDAPAITDALEKLGQMASFTPQGEKEHPIQAAVGQMVDKLKGYLFGGAVNKQNNIGTGEYGMLNNPVAGLVMAAPEDETINLVRNIAKHPVEAAKAAVKSLSSTDAGRAVTQTLSPEMAATPVSITRSAGTTGGAATTQITNEDVLQHAADLGLKMSPAEALQTDFAKGQQTLGESAPIRGANIKAATAADRSKLSDAVEEFQDKLDPARLGLTSESAGEHLQNSAQIAKDVMKENVNNAYDSVKEQQADLAGDATGRLRKLIHDEKFARQPSAAVEQPVLQTSAAKSALDDIEASLSDPAMHGRQSIQSLRNLRTNFLEKANAYGQNALSDSGQRIYKLAASQVDRSIMDAAKGTPFEETFRAAGAQNAKLQELYNQPGSPLYRILNTDDPAKVADGILNRGSVHEIETLKGENFDLGPLARQAVEDIKSGGYRITKDGLGGYPDTFLRSLLGPDQTRELYLKSELARRLSENYNPSGTAKMLMSGSQFNPKVAVASQIAASRAARVDPLSFLPKSPITGETLASPEELFKRPSP